MYIRKLVHGAIAFALAAALLASPALACGRHHGGHHQQASRTVYLCPVEGCEIDGRHTHNGTTYCGYAHAGGICDGKCAALCALEDCQVDGRHVHDDIAFCGYAHECGFCDGTCAALCVEEDCQINGRHTHAGVTYCGYAHDTCFCDGTCANVISDTAYSGRSCHRGCH